MCDHISIDALVCYGTSLDINFIHQNHRTWYVRDIRLHCAERNRSIESVDRLIHSIFTLYSYDVNSIQTNIFIVPLHIQYPGYTKYA